GDVHGLELAAAQVEQLQAVHRGTREGARDPPTGQKCIAAQVEHPLWVAELPLFLRERADLPVALGVEVRPAAAVGDEVEPTVFAPLGLEDRLRRGARDAP